MSSGRSKLEHLLVGDLVEPLRPRHDAGVGGVDAVDVGIDVAAVGADRGGNRNGRSIRSAAAERSDAAGLFVHSLEAGDDRHLLAFFETLDQFGAVDVENARGSVRV
jgi:hypothetical protein